MSHACGQRWRGPHRRNHSHEPDNLLNANLQNPMIGKEPKAATAKRSGPGLGHSAPSSRFESAPQCSEPSPRYPSWPAVIEPRKQAGYMTALDPIADAAQNSS